MSPSFKTDRQTDRMRGHWLLVIMEHRDKIYLPNSITRKINETMVFRKKYSEPHRA